MATTEGKEIVRIEHSIGAHQFENIGEIWLGSRMGQMIFNLELDQVHQQLTDLERHFAQSTLKTKTEKIAEVKKWDQELKSTRRTIANHEGKQKKSLLSWLASFTGLFNTFQIHQVKGTVDNIKGASHKLVTEVDVVQQHLETSDQNINTLKEQLKRTQTNMWHFAQDNSIGLAWEKTNKLIRQILELMTELTDHRLSHELTALFDVEKEWTKFIEIAAHQGYTTPFHEWQYLFHLKTAFAVKGNKIVIAVEIPIVKIKQRSRMLFKLVTGPIHVDNRFYYPTTHAQFVSVESLANGAMPVSVDIEKCTNINFLWFCSGSYVMPHHTPNSCIEAIWLGKDVQQLCHLIATQQRELVKAINDTTAIWYTSDAVNLVISCNDGRHATARLLTSALVTIDRGCRVSTQKFTFASADVNTEDGVRRVVNQQMSSEEGTYTDWGLTSWSLQQPKKIERRAEEIEEILRNAEPPLIPVWVAVLLAAIAVVVVLIFILWLYVQARRHWTFPAPEVKRVERTNEEESMELTHQ